ncbi:hypothetical protein [Methanocella conradii]|uniref:hypothetical protein n=1 Tax=Methanocella conradii TaxID=1175444 RepID=UPI00157D1CD5|nr:hypothetical protein [Methanocella conradii]
MSDDEAWQAIVDKGVRGVFQGISRVAVSTGGKFYPQDEGLDHLMEGMRSVKASELLFEWGGGKLLAVKHDYGDSVAAIYYDGPISPADLARLVQLMFTRRDQRACNKALVPATRVKTVTSRWKRRIALVFGEGFASRLVETSLKGKDKGMLTLEDLEDARIVISRALGNCLPLDKG